MTAYELKNSKLKISNKMQSFFQLCYTIFPDHFRVRLNYSVFLGDKQPRRGKRSASRPIVSSCSCSSPPSRSPWANQRCRIPCAPTTPLCTPCRTSNPGPRTGNRARTPADQTAPGAFSVRTENLDQANMKTVGLSLSHEMDGDMFGPEKQSFEWMKPPQNGE